MIIEIDDKLLLVFTVITIVGFIIYTIITIVSEIIYQIKKREKLLCDTYKDTIMHPHVEKYIIGIDPYSGSKAYIYCNKCKGIDLLITYDEDLGLVYYCSHCSKAVDTTTVTKEDYDEILRNK